MNQHEKTQAQIEILEIMRDGAARVRDSYKNKDGDPARTARIMNSYAADLCDSYIEDLRGHLPDDPEES